MLGTCLRLAEVTRKPLAGKTHELLGSYLIANMPRLATLSWAPDLFGQLETLVKDCERITAVHDPKVFAGNCPECQEDLYARKGDKEARCPTCGATYEVLAWRQHATKAAKYYVGTATDLSRKLAAPEYGFNVTADQIRKWGTRLIQGQPKLVRQNPTHDIHGTPLVPTYRLDHVHELATNRKPLDGTAA